VKPRKKGSRGRISQEPNGVLLTANVASNLRTFFNVMLLVRVPRQRGPLIVVLESANDRRGFIRVFVLVIAQFIPIKLNRVVN